MQFSVQTSPLSYADACSEFIDASSIPIPESQPATPPVSPLSLPYSPQSPRIEADYTEQLEDITISDSD